MNRRRLLVGMVLGIVGPALGISANADMDIETGTKAWGKTVAALCLTLTGCALILRETLKRKDWK